MKRKLLFGLVVLAVIIAACNNPFFPEKKIKGGVPVNTTPEVPVVPDQPQDVDATPEVPVVPDQPQDEVYTIVIDISGDETGDTVTASPNVGIKGDTITLTYNVANTKHYNELDFDGVTVAIASAESAGSGERTYTINSTDASNYVITITAVFTHTDLIIDHITFTETGHINKTYGDPSFTNAITDGYSGTGAITYRSSDTTVAMVDGSGQVTILNAGSAVITAEKAADAVYAHAQAEYTLAVAKAAGAAVTQPSVNSSPTSNSITVNAVSLQTATGQDIEYAISITSGTTPTSGWQSSVTFNGLNAGTTYYVYARSASNDNYEAGTVNVSAGIKTVNPTVTFNSNGGSSVSSQTITAGNAASRPGNPTRSDYVFDYWYQDSGLTTIYNFNTPVTANIILYARWVSAAVIQEIANNMTSITDGTNVTFMMGSPAGEPYRNHNETQHSVTLTKSFSMSKYQITQVLYQAIMGALPSSLPSSPYGVGDNYPVYYVSWYDAIVFCNKLSMMEELDPVYNINGSTDPAVWGTVPTSINSTWAVVMDRTKNGYRLPTEAEWEYACRAGTTTAYNTGATISDDTGWYSYNSESKTHEVGLKPPNAWGLYDMHGNVFEWCWDWFGGDYSGGAQTDPLGVSSSSYRVMRGGSWNVRAEDLRSAYRNTFAAPIYRGFNLGIRLVRP